MRFPPRTSEKKLWVLINQETGTQEKTDEFPAFLVRKPGFCGAPIAA
jgi:hypothetical protein